MSAKRFVIGPDDQRQEWRICKTALDAVRRAAVDADRDGIAREVIIRKIGREPGK